MLIKRLLSIIIVLSSLSTQAQFGIKDSLLFLVEHAENDTTKANHYIELSQYFMRENPFEAAYYAEKAIKYHQEGNNRDGECRALTALGGAFARQGSLNEATAIMFEAIALAEDLNSSALKAIAYNNMGNIYLSLGEYESALQYLNMSHDLHEQMDNKQEMSDVLNNIGITYKYMDDYDKSREMYLQSMKLREETGDISGVADLYNNLALLFLRLDSTTIGYDSALVYFKHSLNLNLENNNYYGLCANYGNMSRIYMGLDKLDTALYYGLIGIDLAEDRGYRTILRNSVSNVQETYALLMDYENAYKYMVWYTGLNDSLNEEAQSKELAILESKHEIENLEKEAELNELALDASNKRNIIFIGGLSVAIVLVVIILLALRQKRKDNLLITAQRDRVHQQKKMVEQQKVLVEEKNKEILDSINYAKLLQDALLPDISPLNKHFCDSFVTYLPKDIVSGDFYWVAEPEKNVIAFAVGDCTGHGVPGALLTMMGQNYLHLGLTESEVTTPGKALGFIDKGFKQLLTGKEQDISGQGMDISMCAINTSSLELIYSGARNPLLLIRQGEIIEFKGDKRGIGESVEQGPFNDHILPLIKGDTIYLFSDGFVDQFGGSGGKKFKIKPFKELLVSIQTKTMSEQRELIESEFTTWKGDLEQIDDVCLMGVRI